MRIALLPGLVFMVLFTIFNFIAFNSKAMSSHHRIVADHHASLTNIQNIRGHQSSNLGIQKSKRKKGWKQWKQFFKKNASGRNQWVAFVLCLFLGFLGIHRFYLGYHLTGIIYLFTIGFFLIGWLVDLIFLLFPNMLPPKGHICY